MSNPKKFAVDLFVSFLFQNTQGLNFCLLIKANVAS